MQRMLESPISKVVVADTIPCGARTKALDAKLEVLTVAPLLGEAIHRIHHDQSISALFRHAGGAKR